MTNGRSISWELSSANGEEDSATFTCTIEYHSPIDTIPRSELFDRYYTWKRADKAMTDSLLAAFLSEGRKWGRFLPLSQAQYHSPINTIPGSGLTMQ